MRDQYKFVCAHFTEAAANSYVRNNRHNLNNPRVYVTSQYRCYEWNDTVEFIKNLDGEK